MTKYSNEFFGIPADDTRFNLPAAVDAYEWVLGNYDTARFVISKALYDNVPKDIRRHQSVVDAAANDFVSKSIESAKRGMARSYISKKDGGQDTETSELMIKAIDQISKAYGDGNYTTWERQANVGRQQRDKKGRFIVMNNKVQPDLLRRPINQNIANQNSAGGLGIPNAQLSSDQRRKFQNDYMQVKQALNQQMDNPDRLWAVGKYTDGSDYEMPLAEARIAINDHGSATNGLVTGGIYRNNQRIKEIDIVDPTQSSANFDVLAGMSNPRFANMVAGGLESAQPFTQDWTAQGPDDYRTNDQFWRRMGAASQMAAIVGAPVLPPAATMALQAGKWAGDLAPEAEKVIGPTARRAAYRYRGVEKKPDQDYQRFINGYREKASTSNSPNPGRRAHDALIRGADNPKTGEHIDSPLILKMKSLLTDPQRYELNRKAGIIPPSQGIIINRKGQVVTEAVGYGEDWYVPFDLKNLNRLDGGEYIRTRAYGGITPEDIMVGLVSGARSVTVVSHSGVFNVEFDDTFRGSRRYNDKAARMQDRYEHLLDAVKSKNVRMGKIPAERMEEIKDEAGDVKSGGYNPVTARADYEDRVRELVAEEKENPRLSKEQTDRTINGLLNEYAMERGAGTWDDFVAQQAVKGNRDLYNKINSENLMLAATAVGLGQQAEKAVAEATAVYQQELAPLDINGKGYHQALLALKDQFPYYMRDPYYSGGPLSRDFGYVKPRYIRPEGAMDGYYDPTITGKGKISADRTNYQNYSNERSRPVTPDDFTLAGQDEDVNPSGRAMRRGRTGTSDSARLDLLVDQIRALQGQRTINRDSGLVMQDDQGNDIDMAGKPIDDAVKGIWASDYGWDFLMDDIDDIERRVYAAGVSGAEYQRLREAVDAAFDHQDAIFRITRDDVRSDAQRDILGAPPTNAMSTILEFPSIADGSQKFNWRDLNEDQDSDYYASKIKNWSRNAPAFDGIDPTDRDALAEAMLERGESLKRELRAAHAGTGRMTVDEVSAEVEAMAKIMQATYMRENAMPSRPTSKPRAADPFDEASEEEAYEEPEEPTVEDSETVKREKRIAMKQEEIRNMVGMKTVADEIDGLVYQAQMDKWREEHGMPVIKDATRHMVFVGNPGTGKTTIARQLAPILADIGVIEKPEVAELTVGEIAGEFTNQVNTNATKVLNANKGKVIFIDEAYTMLDDDNGKVAYTTLMTWADDNKDDTVVVLAGYPTEMSKFLRANPGMARRFPTTIHFPNYSGKDLQQIASNEMEKKMMSVEPDAQRSLNFYLNRMTKEDNYANVGSAKILLQKIERAHSGRIARTPDVSREDRLTYTIEDVKNGWLLSQEQSMKERAKKAKVKGAA